jgi:hypothetical protein
MNNHRAVPWFSSQVFAIHQSIVPHVNVLSRMLNRKQFYQSVSGVSYVMLLIISCVNDGNLDFLVV